MKSIDRYVADLMRVCRRCLTPFFPAASNQRYCHQCQGKKHRKEGDAR